jgi:hypothetical protein
LNQNGNLMYFLNYTQLNINISTTWWNKTLYFQSNKNFPLRLPLIKLLLILLQQGMKN